MRSHVMASWLLILLAVLASCGHRRQDSEANVPLRVEVRADSGGAQRMRVGAPPRARIWVASVAPVRSSPMEADLPEAAQDSVLPSAPSPPMLEIDDDLKAPILKSGTVLVVPARYSHSRTVESVELDVRVDEVGEVTDALWAGGSNSTDLVQAATECALRMRFFPALQAGQPLPVWCRQRFDFGGSAR